MQLIKASKPGPICHYLPAQSPGRGDDSVHYLTVRRGRLRRLGGRGGVTEWHHDHGTVRVRHGSGTAEARAGDRQEQVLRRQCSGSHGMDGATAMNGMDGMETGMGAHPRAGELDLHASSVTSKSRRLAPGLVEVEDR